MKLSPLRMREQMDDPRMDRVQQARDELARSVASVPWLQGQLLVGIPQSDGSITDGIQFTASQTRELPHGLGRKAQGFIVVDVQGNEERIRRAASTAGLETTHVKLVHDGASTTRVKIWIW